MTAALTLQIDRTSGEFQPAELRLRVRGPDGQVLTQDPVVTAIELSPPDLVTVTPISDPTPGVLAYRCDVDTAAIGRDAELVQKGGTRSVTMTIRALPGDGYEQPLVATCPIDVVLPGPTITWYTNGDRSTTGQPARVEAAAGTEMTLHVRLERFFPSEGRFTTVDDAMFSHMVNVGPDGRTAFSFEIFGVHPAARPWEAPPGSRCEVSRWKLMTDLPPEGRPELAAPSTTFIRVRGWNAGVITARYPDRIATSEAHVAECFVPVHFVPVEATAELLEPPMPIPADGRQVELVVVLRRAGSDAPAPGVPVSLSLRHHADAEGSLDPAGTSVTSDGQGLVQVHYTTPALTYRVGGRYLEELVVARADGGSDDEIAVFPLHLNPELRAELHVAKDGLEFDTVRIHRPAGRTPATVSGDLSLTVENRIVPGEQRSPVEHAEAMLVPEVAGAGPSGPVDGLSCRSSDNGAIGLTLEELREGWATTDESRRRDVETPLDADREIPAGRFDADVTLVIDQYDDRIEQSSWWLAQAGAAIDHRMATHRLTLGEQLAVRPESDLPRAISGTLILERATHIPPLVWRRYQFWWSTVGDQLGGFFDAVVSFALSALDVAGKLREGLESVAAWIAKLVSSLGRTVGTVLTTIGRLLTSAFGTVLTMMQKLMQSFGQTFPALNEKLAALYHIVVDLLAYIAEQLGQSDAGQAIAKLLTGLAAGLGKFFTAVIDTVVAVVATLLEALAEAGTAIAEAVAERFPWVAEIKSEYLLPLAAKLGIVVPALNDPNVERGFVKWAVSELLKKLLGWISKSVNIAVHGGTTLSGAIAAGIRDRLDVVFTEFGDALAYLKSFVDDLFVPEDPTRSRGAAQERAAALQSLERMGSSVSATINTCVHVLDTLWAMAKVVVIAVLGVKTVVGATTVSELLTKVDLAYSKMKALSIHLPAGLAAAVASFGNLLVGLLIVIDMSSDRAGTPSGVSAGQGGASGTFGSGGSSGQFGRRSGGSGTFLVPAGVEPAW